VVRGGEEKTMSLDEHLFQDILFREPSAGLTPLRAIHRCLEHIWRRFHLRARLFVLERNGLVLRDCVGAYRCCPEIGLKVRPGSRVWEIFAKGDPVNLTQSDNQKGRPHTLPERITIKAVIPLKNITPEEGEGEILGVLVVDAGDALEPIEERDFQYLEVVGMLITEILDRSNLIEKIQAIQREKDRMAREVSHIFRNRFTVIGGLALRLSRALSEPSLKRWAKIIVQEVANGEQALEAWRKSHRKGGIYDG
jgi:signal transduction histidine kinase